MTDYSSFWNTYSKGNLLGEYGTRGLLTDFGIKNAGKYGQFLEEYDPYKETRANKEYGLQRNLLFSNYGKQIEGLLGAVNAKKSKSNFAFHGGIEDTYANTLSQTRGEFGGKVKSLQAGRNTAIEDSRRSYMEDTLADIENLVKNGAEMYTTGDTKVTDTAIWERNSEGQWVYKGSPFGDTQNPNTNRETQYYDALSVRDKIIQRGTGAPNWFGARVGDTKIGKDGKLWEWNGTEWVPVEGDSGGSGGGNP